LEVHLQPIRLHDVVLIRHAVLDHHHHARDGVKVIMVCTHISEAIGSNLSRYTGYFGKRLVVIFSPFKSSKTSFVTLNVVVIIIIIPV
jgi:hypothetical protein